MSNCYYCGILTSTANPKLDTFRTVDHKIPRSRGGSNLPQNKVTSCYRCNQDKGRLTPSEYQAVLKIRKGSASDSVSLFPAVCQPKEAIVGKIVVEYQLTDDLGFPICPLTRFEDVSEKRLRNKLIKAHSQVAREYDRLQKYNASVAPSIWGVLRRDFGSITAVMFVFVVTTLIPRLVRYI